MSSKSARDEPDWDTTCHDDFYRHYAYQSDGEADWERFQAIQSTIWRALGRPAAPLRVGDIGCGAGTQSRLWAGLGHRVQGVDINEALITLARQRARQAGLDIQFAVASATALPWDDGAMDVCVAPELLEHVTDWTTCLSEMVRVLRPGGALFISTSNKLCPSQEEFSLPLYSWYPAWVKRRCEHLARTTQPWLAGHATYPAVNWFTYYSLRAHLERQGLHCMDRFDMLDLAGRGAAAAALVRAIRRWPALRFLGHVATPYTVLLGFTPAAASGSAAGANQSATAPRPMG